jgi:hypothetical protein
MVRHYTEPVLGKPSSVRFNQQHIQVFINEKLRVSLALQRVEGKLQFSVPKTERSRRILPRFEYIEHAS